MLRFVGQVEHFSLRSQTMLPEDMQINSPPRPLDGVTSAAVIAEDRSAFRRVERFEETHFFSRNSSHLQNFPFLSQAPQSGRCCSRE